MKENHIKKGQSDSKQRRCVWFTSDLHFTHPSILRFHPWRMNASDIDLDVLNTDKEIAIEKHDEWLIDLWNSIVKRNDSVYVLGDFCLGNKERTEKILRQLKGKKFLIRGNHDKSLNGLDNYFEWVGDIKEVKFNNQMFDFIDPDETFCVELCHYPLLTWNRRTHGSCMVHGHTHGGLDLYNEKSKELRVDVGLDGKLANKSFIELKELYNYFVNIKNNAACKTFQEYAEKLMAEQGFRM